MAEYSIQETSSGQRNSRSPLDLNSANDSIVAIHFAAIRRQGLWAFQTTHPLSSVAEAVKLAISYPGDPRIYPHRSQYGLAAVNDFPEMCRIGYDAWFDSCEQEIDGRSRSVISSSRSRNTTEEADQSCTNALNKLVDEVVESFDTAVECETPCLNRDSRDWEEQPIWRRQEYEELQCERRVYELDLSRYSTCLKYISDDTDQHSAHGVSSHVEEASRSIENDSRQKEMSRHLNQEVPENRLFTTLKISSNMSDETDRETSQMVIEYTQGKKDLFESDTLGSVEELDFEDLAGLDLGIESPPISESMRMSEFMKHVKMRESYDRDVPISSIEVNEMTDSVKLAGSLPPSFLQAQISKSQTARLRRGGTELARKKNHPLPKKFNRHRSILAGLHELFLIYSASKLLNIKTSRPQRINSRLERHANMRRSLLSRPRFALIPVARFRTRGSRWRFM